jgi:hypothetical protein
VTLVVEVHPDVLDLAKRPKQPLEVLAVDKLGHLGDDDLLCRQLGVGPLLLARRV